MARTRPSVEPVPDGAIMIKEMYSPPAAACASIDPTYLLPTVNSSAVMIRDSKGSHDGWMWGWYGWGAASMWAVDWPASQWSPYPAMGFGQYCTNCHASAKDNSTFASLKNIKDEPGNPLVFLSQNFFLDPAWKSLQARIMDAATQDAKAKDNDPPYNDAFKKAFPSIDGMPLAKDAPLRSDIVKMPPETYDSVWAKPGGPHASNQYLTSDQCLGCHSAGGTGLQFDMTQPGPDGKLVNISPYGTWRGSPMGLAGRDPIFFAQLGKRDADIPSREEGDDRGHVPRLPRHSRPASARDRHQDQHRHLSAVLARCRQHDPVRDAGRPRIRSPRWRITARSRATASPARHAITWCSARKTPRNIAGQPQNVCVEEKQKALNPDLTGFAATFTGAFLVGPPNQLYGPFKEPKKKPMKHAINVDPEHSQNITSSEMCGSCHTVHLPIMHKGETIGRVYEQTTYPEWAFSDYRTGDSPVRRPAARLRRAGAVLSGLPHAEQGRVRQSVPQQDRGDPGVQQLPASREHAAAGATSTCRCARASASTRWSGSTSICSRWRGSSPTSSASARPIRC